MKNYPHWIAGIVILLFFCLTAPCWADTYDEEKQADVIVEEQPDAVVEERSDAVVVEQSDAVDGEQTDAVDGDEVLISNKAQEEETFPVPPPLVYQGLFPCQACDRSDVRGVSSGLEKSNSLLDKYIRKPDPKPRTLIKMHRNINLRHAKWHWCLNCHDKDERNYLHLITGEKIPFEKSYRLCGQCHGIIYRDWKIGIHGRRVGNWNGKKLYLLCSHCHDPHSPKKLPAEDPPKKPNFGRWEVAAHE